MNLLKVLNSFNAFTGRNIIVFSAVGVIAGEKRYHMFGRERFDVIVVNISAKAA